MGQIKNLSGLSFRSNAVFTWLLCVLAISSQVAGAESRAAPYLGPGTIASSKDGTTLYLACEDACCVMWMDTAKGEVRQRIEMPNRPTGIAVSPDGSTLAITCSAPASVVQILDAETGSSRVSMPGGHTSISPVFSPDGQRLYVCNRFDNSVSVYDLAGGREVWRLPATREPIVCRITPDGASLLVADHLPAARVDFDSETDATPFVTMYNTSTWEAKRVPLPHGANNIRGLCVFEGARYALVTHLLSNFQMVPFRVDTGWIDVNVLSVIDLSAGKVIRTIGLDEYDRGAGNPWDVSLALDDRYVCVSISGTHELGVIETATLLSDRARRTMQPMMGAWPIYTSLGESLWRRIALPGKGPRGMVATGSKIHVAEYFSDTVAVVDLLASVDATPRQFALGPAPKLTEERWGEMLFHDATICYQHWLSCSSCHPDARTDALNWDLMNDGVGNPKNTKSMLLTHQTPPSMAEGVRMSAEQAVRAGIEHVLFTRRPEAEATAMDTYLKSLEPVPSPHLIHGRCSDAAVRGQELFESDRTGCARCHPAPLYTDLKSHNVGSRNRHEYSDRFDTPTLIEAWRTAPYLHDGRYVTIRDLLTEGRHGMNGVRGDPLSAEEIDDLVAFVMSL